MLERLAIHAMCSHDMSKRITGVISAVASKLMDGKLLRKKKKKIV